MSSRGLRPRSPRGAGSSGGRVPATCLPPAPMIQFVLGWKPSGGLDLAPAADALAGVIAREGFLDSARLRRWRAPDGHAALAWAAHDPGQVGGVEYVHAAERPPPPFAGGPARPGPPA